MTNILSEKIYLALDESGKLNKNDVGNYFVVGGFIYTDKEFVKSKIKKAESEIRQKYNIPKEFEIKGNKLEEMATIELINKVFKEVGDAIKPIFSVVSRNELNEHFTVSEMLAYDFFVNNIIHFFSKYYNFESYCRDIFILMDERNLKKTDLNQLENLLKTNFIEKPFNITTYYLSSKLTDVVRFADILDHVVYTYYNNPDSSKNELYQKNIKKDILNKLSLGTIYYPFKKSYFKSLNQMKAKSKK